MPNADTLPYVGVLVSYTVIEVEDDRPPMGPTEPADADCARSADVPEEAGPFVLNLCPLPGPIIIPQARSPHLIRFRFFCSRGSEEEGKFWLRMAYFLTRAEADKWLAILRAIYPQAFVSEAPITVVPNDCEVPEQGMAVVARRRIGLG